MNLKLTLSATIAAFVAFAAISAPAHASFLYSSGPVNGTVDAWNISGSYAVTDSFTLTTASDVDTALYYSWEFAGDHETGIDWAITSAPFGGTIYATGSAAPVTAVVFPLGTVNPNLADIDSNAISIGVNLLPGSYWLVLDAATDTGGSSYWDENDGAGQAYQYDGYNSPSTISSTPVNAFNLYGTTYVPTPEASTYVGLLLGVAGLAAFGIMSARRRSSLSA